MLRVPRRGRPGQRRAAPRLTSAADFLPERRDLAALRRAAAGCRGCALWQRGTRTVFSAGRGADHRRMGSSRAASGRRGWAAFVRPAGQLLDRLLVEAGGIDRERAYVTNAVKHFKWTPRGKRRVHAKPGSLEIRACGPWLEAEIAAVRPQALVCLGATAAQALLGAAFRVTRDRGRFVPSPLARRWCWRRCIPRRCFAPPTRRPGRSRSAASSPTWRWSPTR
ncbi:MAG: uracil-DNA glycosylase family protein [Dongiaceae bacterium]